MSCLKWDGLLQKGVKSRRFLNTSRRTNFVQAVAVPVSPSPLDTAEYREQLAETYGFKQIGEPLPVNVTLRDIIESLPKEVLYSFSKCSQIYINRVLNVIALSI